MTPRPDDDAAASTDRASGGGFGEGAGEGEGGSESLTEGFGGEATSVVPDDAPSSRWDRNAQDEDALIADGPGES